MMIKQFAWFVLLSLLTINIDDNMFIHGQCLKDQSSSLLQLKQSLSLSFTTSKLLSWNSTRDCCSWDGVTCDGVNGHVIGLDLSEEFISGGVDNSSDLFKLTHLERLNLAYNKFSGAIPLGLDQFYNLTHLNLSYSGFTGQVPIGISRMKRLVSLDLSADSYFGNLELKNPNLRTLVKDLSELRELSLDGVNISMNGKEWSQALSSVLPNLKVLSLQNCYLSGPFDSSLLKLGSLSELRLGSNNISAVIPEFFGSLSNLTLLYLYGCNLFGPIPPSMSKLTQLQHLDLSGNNLIGPIPPSMSKLTQLLHLDLSWNNLFGQIPPSISKLTQLHYLDLSENNLIGPIPPSMSKLTQLHHLDLAGNNLIGPIPNLNLSKHLTFIDLSYNCLTGPISSLQWDIHLNLEKLYLNNNSLNGTIPPILFTLPSLLWLDLYQNQFTGQLGELFFNQSSSVLEGLDLSNNRLEETIPLSLFGLSSLQMLDLSFNNFSGTLRLNMFQKLKNLYILDLSDNKLSIISSGINSSLFPQIEILRLASCNLTEFPRFLSNQSLLTDLDLSNNQIRGRIPNWIWKIGNGSIRTLNLSLNFLENPEQPLPSLSFKELLCLDLHSNLLQGSLPILPPAATILDYSNNKLNSVIPADIGSYLHSAKFFSLSNNSLKGEIPMSICEATRLQLLDLSSNGLRGSIPQCLSSNLELSVLKLRSNNLHGIIPEPFPIGCGLRTLDLNGNRVKGEISKSLSNCTSLEILDLGNNLITGTFPSWLGELTNLRVLVLRSNKFYGHIGHLESNITFNMFQIIDLSSNKFTGSLPAELFLKWKGMMTNNHNQQIVSADVGGSYYQDSVTIVIKGMEMELVKILTIFTSIDLSNNQFEGEIPQVIGDLTQLYVLNLSHNVLTGSIPSSLGNLKQLGSLDLSDNKLSGGIPKQLADLTFLAVLNLSYNQLVGRIPQGPQFQTYTNDSFEENNGLCGPPLSKTCRDDVKEVPSTTPDEDMCKFSLFKDCTDGDTLNWQLISLTMGFGVGIGIAICIAVSWPAWNRLCVTISKKILNMD